MQQLTGPGERHEHHDPANIVASSPAVHLGADDGEAFRLGSLEIIVKENGSGTRTNLDVIAKAMGHYGLQPVNPSASSHDPR